MPVEPVTTRGHGSPSRAANKPDARRSQDQGPGRGSTSSDGTVEDSGERAHTEGTTLDGTGASAVWPQRSLPGGRKLWRRLVIGFAFVASLGAVFITLGAVYFKEAYEWSKEETMTMPLVMCILAIVIGTLFVIGSVVLGKLIISNKWRKNEQPTYRNIDMATVRFHRPSACEEGQVVVQMEPPSYEASAHDATNPPSQVFIISGREVNVNMGNRPPPYSESFASLPPEYTEAPTPGDTSPTEILQTPSDDQQDSTTRHGDHPSLVVWSPGGTPPSVSPPAYSPEHHQQIRDVHRVLGRRREPGGDTASHHDNHKAGHHDNHTVGHHDNHTPSHHDNPTAGHHGNHTAGHHDNLTQSPTSSVGSAEDVSATQL